MADAALQKFGLQAVLDVAAFNQGVRQFNAGVDQMNAKMGGAQQESSKTASVMSTVLAGAVGGLVVSIGSKLVGAIGKATSALTGFIGESIMVAARAKEMGIVVDYVSQAYGHSSEAARDAVSALMEHGATMEAAQNTMVAFARYNLDAAKAVELLDLAQALAILRGQDSSETLEQLIYGITTYNKRVLKTAGLNIDVAGSYDEFGDSATEAQKVQSVFNEVLKSGEPLLGLYDAAMQSASKQMRSIPRDINNLQRALGEPFEGALFNAVKGIRGFIQAITDAVSEGGKLRPLLVNIGAVLSLLTEPLLGVGDATSSVIDWLAIFGNTMWELAWDALEWGINIVTYLAIGIVKAAEIALVPAMKTITELLSFWMAPGSPPRIAPDIDKWGMEAMTEYLRGFTKVDFSVLAGIKSPLKSVLDALVGMGKLGKKEAASAYADLSKELIKALSTGVADEGLFGRLAQAGGMFGEELADLARKQIELARATGEVEEAERQLEEARKAQEDAQEQVSDLTSEYNRLLRAGASREILDAKLTEINAAEEQVALAGEQAVEAEVARDEAQSRVDLLKEQAELQDELLKQLLDLFAVEKDLGTVGAGLAGSIGSAVDAITTKVPEIGSTLTAEIDTAKEGILLRFQEIWQGAQSKWDEFGQPAVDNITQSWDTLQTTFEEFKDWFEGEGFMNAMIRVFEGTFEYGKRKVLEFAFGGIFVAIGLADQLLTVLGLGGLEGVVRNLGSAIEVGITAAWLPWFIQINDLLGVLGIENGMYWILESLRLLVEGNLTKAWETFKLNILDPIATKFETINTAINNVISSIGNLINKIMEQVDIPDWLSMLLGHSPPPLAAGIDMVRASMRQLQMELPQLASAMQLAPVPATTMAAAPSYSRATTVNMGGVTINDRLDAAAFENRVRQIVEGML